MSIDYNKFLKMWDATTGGYELIPFRNIAGVYYKPGCTAITITRCSGGKDIFKYSSTAEARGVFDNICTSLEAWDTFC